VSPISELILNYFRAQKLLSSGVVEGLNNKAKVTMRQSYGFRTFRCLELALTHLASCPSRNRPTDSSDEPGFQTISNEVLLNTGFMSYKLKALEKAGHNPFIYDPKHLTSISNEEKTMSM
jgi:hypothetical protein